MTVDDWRALCAELLDKYDLEWRARERIQVALAEPELYGELTDDVLRDIYDEFAEFFDSSDGFGTTAITRYEWPKAARAVESVVRSSRSN